MSKPYYTDPLAAAIMARDFGVKLTNKPGEQIEFSNVFGGVSWKMITDDAFYTGKRFCIHTDSHHIFDPQVGDLVTINYSDEYILKVSEDCEYDLNKAHENYRGNRISLSNINDCEFKIIQRNNKPLKSI